MAREIGLVHQSLALLLQAEPHRARPRNFVKYHRSLLAILVFTFHAVGSFLGTWQLLAWLPAWEPRGHWHYLTQNHTGHFVIGALILNLLPALG